VQLLPSHPPSILLDTFKVDLDQEKDTEEKRGSVASENLDIYNEISLGDLGDLGLLSDIDLLSKAILI
jgi:hypothetical protein